MEWLPTEVVVLIKIAPNVSILKALIILKDAQDVMMVTIPQTDNNVFLALQIAKAVI